MTNKSDLNEHQTSLMVGTGKTMKFENGKKLGAICKDKVLRIFKTESRHLFRMWDSWNINQQQLREFIDVGGKFIEIHTTDTKKIYKCSVNDYMNFGMPYKNPKDEGDFQLGLPRRYFQVIEK